jgi:hypothetical protein
VHFYSSGAIEKDWKIKGLDENFMVAASGSILGAVLRRPDDARFHRLRNDRESTASAVRQTLIHGELGREIAGPVSYGLNRAKSPALRLLHAVLNWLPGRRCPGTLSNHLVPASSPSQMYCLRGRRSSCSSAQTRLRMRSWYPPLAKCAKDGAPLRW